MRIKFLGAAGTVTGSKYLLTINKKEYLVDCGLFQGLKNLRLRNWQEDALSAPEIKAVFLTHAHIDHSGYIPRLIKNGFSGEVYCSKPTFELLKILLPDSGHLQEEEANYANKKGYSKHKPALPLYTRKDAEDALSFVKPVEFHEPIKINPDVQVTFSRAGHILGASCILVEAANRRIVFSGDVGRPHDIIMRPPEPLPDADYLVIESTYGDRSHEEEDFLARMAEIINAAVKNKGAVVVPAFAVGRAQHVLHLLAELKAKKQIPDVKTFLDSPMAINATDLYRSYRQEHRLSDKDCEALFGTAIITRTPEESRAINDVPGPKIIISASGMASGGRILHHLAQYISDPRNVIVVVGFQAEGTRGRALLEGASQIKMLGTYYPVEAKIENLLGLSAHADREELVNWLRNSPIKHPKVFVTHGEQSSAEAFAETLRETFHWQVTVPKDGDEYDL